MKSMWEKIFREYLKHRDGERIVVIADAPVELPLEAEVIVAPSTGGHGREPALEVWQKTFGVSAVSTLELNGLFDLVLAKTLSDSDLERLLTWGDEAVDLAPDIVLAVTNYSTSHTSFRRLLTRTGARYASMPRFRTELLRQGGPIDVDVAALIKRTRALTERLSDAVDIHITTPIGTDLRFSVKGRPFEPDDGDLSQPGSFGNLPAGEVYAAPIEGSGEGTLAITEGVLLRIVQGSVVGISGDGESPIRDLYERHPEYLKLAEIGIGTNDAASDTENVLEAEKILGTVHIAFGDNSGFGGRQQIPYHEDHVLFDPSISLNGQDFSLPERP